MQWQQAEAVYKVSVKKPETPVGKGHLVWYLLLRAGHQEQQWQERGCPVGLGTPSSRKAYLLIDAFKIVSKES